MYTQKEKSISLLNKNKTNFLIIISIGYALLLQAGCSSGSARITFENEVLDFGQVRPGTNNIGELKFTNTGKSLLKITEVERCCGVSAKVDKTQYKPGQSGALRITYPAGSRPGVIKRIVYVNSNDKINPRIPLTIEAEIVMNVNWEPKTIKLSPEMENAGCPQIIIKSIDGTKKFSIKRFISTGNCINADIDPSVQATEFTIQPKVDTSKLTQNSRGNININLVYADQNEPSNIITIQFNATERFSIAPRSLVMFYSNPQKPVAKTLKITRNYGDDFEIENVSSKAGHVKVLEQENIEDGFQFKLEITPEPVDEEGRFKDTLIITLKDGSNIQISCGGILSVPDEDEE